MKVCGVVKKLDSPWCSSVIVIRNNDDLCFCATYQRLNNITKKECLLPPRIDETLDKLTRASQLPTMDLNSGNLQDVLCPGHMDTAGFSTVHCYALWPLQCSSSWWNSSCRVIIMKPAWCPGWCNHQQNIPGSLFCLAFLDKILYEFLAFLKQITYPANQILP
jgi:hypothetical protein